MSNAKAILWAYLSEILLATLAFGLLCLFYDASELTKFLKPIASDIATYFSSIMFAASVAFLWAFYSKSDTPFSKWLYEKGAFTVYLSAYIVAVSIYAFLFVLLLITSRFDNSFFSMFTLWFLIVGIINVYTFIRNVVGQLMLNMEFNSKNDRKS